MDILESTPGIYHRVHRSEDGRIDAVFFSFEWTLQQWQENQEVLSFDSTYRVNRFNMPLLQVTGVTALNTTFTIVVCLISGEKEDDFLWALQQLRDLARERNIQPPSVILSDKDSAFKNAASNVFPDQQQLCIWHILKNAVHNIRIKWSRQADQQEQQATEHPDKDEDSTENSEEIERLVISSSPNASGADTHTQDGCIRA